MCRAGEQPPLGTYSQGGPERTGAFPAARLPDRPETAWIADLGDDSGQPVIAGDRLIVGNRGGHLVALSLKDASSIWDVIIPDLDVMSPPVVVDDRVYCASNIGLTAHETANGGEVWRHPIEGGAVGASPLVVDGLVIAGGSDGFVHALDARTGEVRWKADIVADAPDDPEGFDGAKARIGISRARPVTASSDGTNVFVPIFDQSRVAALDIKTGEPRWSYQTKGWVSDAPTVGSGKVFIGSQDHKVYALDAKTGKLAWMFETRWRADGAVAYHEGSVFSCASDGRCYRIDAQTGKKVWEYETEVGPDKKHYFLSGVQLVDAESVYFGSNDGHLYALRREDGTLKWRHKPSVSGEHVGAPITDGKRFYVTIRPIFDFEAQRDKEGIHGVAAIGEARP